MRKLRALREEGHPAGALGNVGVPSAGLGQEKRRPPLEVGSSLRHPVSCGEGEGVSQFARWATESRREGQEQLNAGGGSRDSIKFPVIARLVSWHRSAVSTRHSALHIELPVLGIQQRQ